MRSHLYFVYGEDSLYSTKLKPISQNTGEGFELENL